MALGLTGFLHMPLSSIRHCLNLIFKYPRNRNISTNICDALRYLVPFLQFKKREKNHGGVLLLAVGVFHVF